MNIKINSILAAVLAMGVMTSCDDSYDPAEHTFPQDTGGVSFKKLGVNVDETPRSTVSRAAIDVSDYIVDIVDGSGNVVVYQNVKSSWAYKNMPEVLTLPVGDYTVKVRSHEVQKAEWSKPYYCGSSDFSIKNGDITYIDDVTCEFASIKVDVRFTDALKKLMGDDAKVTVVCNDEGSLTWTKSETRYGYFEASAISSTMVATFTGTLSGQDITAVKEFTGVTAGSFYVVTFSVKQGDSTVPDEFGGVNPNGISISTSVEEADENGNVPSDDPSQSGEDRPGGEEWPDEPGDDPGNDPGSEAITFTSDFLALGADKVNYIDQFCHENSEGMMEPNEPCVVVIAAEKGIKKLQVTITSTQPNFEAAVNDLLGTSFDLVTGINNKDENKTEALSGLGLPVGDKVLDQTSVNFDITGLVGLLDIYEGTHKFIINVTDAEGAVSEAVLVVVKR